MQYKNKNFLEEVSHSILMSITLVNKNISKILVNLLIIFFRIFYLMHAQIWWRSWFFIPTTQGIITSICTCALSSLFLWMIQKWMHIQNGAKYVKHWHLAINQLFLIERVLQIRSIRLEALSAMATKISYLK